MAPRQFNRNQRGAPAATQARGRFTSRQTLCLVMKFTELLDSVIGDDGCEFELRAATVWSSSVKAGAFQTILTANSVSFGRLPVRCALKCYLMWRELAILPWNVVAITWLKTGFYWVSKCIHVICRTRPMIGGLPYDIHLGKHKLHQHVHALLCSIHEGVPDIVPNSPFPSCLSPSVSSAKSFMWKHEMNHVCVNKTDIHMYNVST